jgi:IS1 family transposase
MTGVAKKTVMRVLVEVGEVCAIYQDQVFRNLRCKRLQLDEMWAWIYCKEKNRKEEIARKQPDAGDVWLWVAIDADSKLVPSWRLGQRDLATATDFVSDLAQRVKGRVQVTTDALRTYVNVIEDAFGSEVDYAQLHKVYRAPMENETRYSPAKCIGCSTKDVSGNPDMKRMQNGSLRASYGDVLCAGNCGEQKQDGKSLQAGHSLHLDHLLPGYAGADHAPSTYRSVFPKRYVALHRSVPLRFRPDRAESSPWFTAA